jgi:hypothetical protein
MSSGFDPLDLPYLGPSRVPLLSIWELKARGLWAARDDAPRDKSTDLTDEDITRMIAWQRPPDAA